MPDRVHPLIAQIREARRRRGWSQQDLAARSGVGQSALSLLETGRREPLIHTLDALAGALGLDVVLQPRKTP
jgi:transcriptional regulator with XRE-family HTH domain